MRFLILLFLLISIKSYTNETINVLPEKLKSKVNQGPYYDGPNCWNEVLVASEIYDHLIFTSKEEFLNIINSDFCVEISHNDIMPGDLIRIIRKDYQANLIEELHAYTYISDTRGFSKKGILSQGTYSFEATKDIKLKWGIDNNCSLVDHKMSFWEDWTSWDFDNYGLDVCSTRSLSYRCSKRNFKNLSPVIQRQWIELGSIAEELEKILFENPQYFLEQDKLLEKLEDLQLEVTSSVLLERIRSLIYQIKIIKIP